MADINYQGIRRWLGQLAILKKYRKIKSVRDLPKYKAVNAKAIGQQQISTVYLCPSNNSPIGGIKVIYKQAAIFNEADGGLKASVLHPFNPEFNCTWFDHDSAIKNNLEFDRTHEFVMIPEFWAVPHARLLHNIGVRYGIYVQGGYIMGLKGSNYGKEHDDAYHNADLILAISDDTAECIKLAFPECSGKTYRVHFSVDANKFKANQNKENIISYMPRKMENHFQLVTYFLNKNIPHHWRIESINGLDEDGVAAIFGKSRIFLSFSELEGCGLPPIEAALSGCYVIGYTGEGGKEYWESPIFTEIHSGDIKTFVKAILNKITEIDSNPSINYMAERNNLANKYSAQVELEDMQFVAKKIIEIMNRGEQS
jgi:glycosyltransferase involved in cell wall biosynthesis